MKNILNYYYKIIVDDNIINDDGYFSYNNHSFCLYQYRRSINEIEALDYLNRLMLLRQNTINRIVKNVFDSVITMHDNRNYVLIEIIYHYADNLSTKFIRAFDDQNLNILKRNNWGKLWGIKIDYIEYQLMHIENSYPIINNSINYYIGLAENAISYFNMLDLSNTPLYISHRRINNSNIYNPLELVLDYKARDIAEYIKLNFFNKKMNILDIKDFINTLSLDNIDYILLYVRLLYPSYYFDLYEEIINDNKKEEEINRIISLSSLYEELLYEIYNLFRKRINILGVDWINKKFM